MEDPFIPFAESILDEVAAANTVPNLVTILRAQVSSGKFNGLNISPKVSYNSITLSDTDISNLAEQIVCCRDLGPVIL